MYSLTVLFGGRGKVSCTAMGHGMQIVFIVRIRNLQRRLDTFALTTGTRQCSSSRSVGEAQQPQYSLTFPRQPSTPQAVHFDVQSILPLRVVEESRKKAGGGAPTSAA